MHTQKRIIAVFVGGEQDGERDDLTDKPGLTAHPSAIGGRRTAYVLDRVEGDVGYYRPASREELDRPLRGR